MLGLPLSTELNRRIPKSKFYEHRNVPHALQQQLINEIDSIHWRHKLAPDTLHISAGERVKEIEVFDIQLKVPEISPAVLAWIDREIPYHIIFVLRYQEKARLYIHYKENSKSDADKFKIETRYQSDWTNSEGLTLNLNGLDLDNVYKNFLIQIADGKLQVVPDQELGDAVVRAKERSRLETRIARLQSRIHKEPQFNRQVEMMGELRRMQEQLKQYG